MRIFIITISLALSVTFAKASSLNITVSDLLEDCSKTLLSNYAETEGNGLTLQYKGSFKAIEDVKSGKCDLAIVASANPLDTEEGLQSYPVAYQSVSICVNKSNDVKELSLEDLKEMYFKDQEKFAKTWTGFGANSSSAVQATTTSFNDNLVVELFKNTVNPDKNLADWVNAITPEANLAAFVRRSNSAVAISGKLLEGTREVPILSLDSNFAALPSPESLFRGEYPFSLTFYLIFDPKNVAKIKNTAKYLLRDKLAEAFNNGGFYAVPEIFRKNFILELDISQ